MDLILWRHCEAEAGEPDLGRRLTSKGVEAGGANGRVARARTCPTPAASSCRPPTARSRRRTALPRKFRTVPSSRPARRSAAVLAAANWPDSREPVLIVGHQPTLGMVASFLLSGEEAYWSVRKGAVWWLSNRVRDSGTAVVLKTVVSPEFL